MTTPQPTKPKGTMATAASDEQGNTSSVRVSGLSLTVTIIVLVLVGAYGAATNNEALRAYIERVLPWLLGGKTGTLLWGQIKSAFVLATKAKAEHTALTQPPQPKQPDTPGQGNPT